MPPLSRLELLFLDSGCYDIHQGSLDTQCNRIREHLRRELALVREVSVPVEPVFTNGDVSEAPPRHHHHRICDNYDRDNHATMRHSITLRPVEDYTNKYKGEQVEVALFGGEYQEGVLTAYCSFEDVPHVELNGHILIPLQNVASLHCSSRCDAPEPDWPPRGFIEDDTGDS